MHKKYFLKILTRHALREMERFQHAKIISMFIVILDEASCNFSLRQRHLHQNIYILKQQWGFCPRVSVLSSRRNRNLFSMPNRSFEDDLGKGRTRATRLKQKGLKVNIKKLKQFMTKVYFLGHWISRKLSICQTKKTLHEV